MKLVDQGITRCERSILKQIEFWYPKAKTVRDGDRWLIRSAAEFQSGGADYAEKTIWAAVRALKRRGVLIVERHKHPYKLLHGPVLWLRPGLYEEPEASSTCSPEMAVGSALPEPFLETENLAEETSEALQQGQEDDVAKTPKVAGSVAAAMMSKPKMSAAEIAAKAGQSQEPLDLIKSPQVAHNLLSQSYSKVYGHSLGSFNPVRGSMMKTFLERVRAEKLSDPEIVQLIATVVDRWDEWRGYAKSQFTLNVKGEKPNHAELVKYAIEIAGWWRSVVKEISPAKGTPKAGVPKEGWLDADFG